MARADAGVGLSDRETDVAEVLRHVTDESQRAPDRTGRLTLGLPETPVMSQMDAEAFAIVAGNLIDNAFQHGAAGSTVHVSLSQNGELRVINECDIVGKHDIARLAQRLQQGRSARHGFGLGLYIANTIVRQVGSTLELRSPPEGRKSGFEAQFTAPQP